MIFMTNPEHGAMFAYSVAESLALQKNGWVESTAEQWLASKNKPAQSVVEVVEPIEASETTAPKKRGRPAKAE